MLRPFINKHIVTLACLGGWWVTVMAATSIDAQIQELEWVSILIAAAIAMWGGFVATISKISFDENSKTISLNVFKDMVSAGSAGFLTYSFAMWQQVTNIWLFAIMLFCAGYAGTRLLDGFAEIFMTYMKNRAPK